MAHRQYLAGAPQARATMVAMPNPPRNAGAAAQSLLLAAAAGKPGSHPPVWFMRQAGRSLPEYRALRADTAMLDACRTPELITEITLQPVRRHGVDAAILFSDIVVPLVAIGLGIDIVPGVGPVVDKPIRESADLDRLRELDATDVPYVTEAVHAGQLPDRGRPVARPCPNQGGDARPAGVLARAAEPAGGHRP